MAEKVKTAMIFVPSVNGISHCPLQGTNWGDIVNGIQVLNRVLKKLVGRLSLDHIIQLK